MSTLCTERRSVDHTSSTKQKITLVEGKSSWTKFCAHLKNTARKKKRQFSVAIRAV